MWNLSNVSVENKFNSPFNDPFESILRISFAPQKAPHGTNILCLYSLEALSRESSVFWFAKAVGEPILGDRKLFKKSIYRVLASCNTYHVVCVL
jgi:hypothetical protein